MNYFQKHIFLVRVATLIGNPFPLFRMVLTSPFPLLPLLVATVASMLVGMLWFSPFMFAKAWMKHTGVKPQKMKKGPGPAAIFVSALTGFLMALAVASLFHLLAIQDVLSALGIVLVVWLGLYAFPQLNHHLYDGRSKELFFIYAGYNLVNLVLTAMILLAWR